MSPAVIKAKFVQKKYGVPIEQYDKMLASQDDMCLICKNTLGLRPHFDHCHDTGVVRGFLCFKCNTGLGLFQDSIEILTAAIEHLRPYK